MRQALQEAEAEGRGLRREVKEQKEEVERVKGLLRAAEAKLEEQERRWQGKMEEEGRVWQGRVEEADARGKERVGVLEGEVERLRGLGREAEARAVEEGRVWQDRVRVLGGEVAAARAAVAGLEGRLEVCICMCVCSYGHWTLGWCLSVCVSLWVSTEDGAIDHP